MITFGRIDVTAASIATGTVPGLLLFITTAVLQVYYFKVRFKVLGESRIRSNCESVCFSAMSGWLMLVVAYHPPRQYITLRKSSGYNQEGFSTRVRHR
jgi:hypothetical protein